MVKVVNIDHIGIVVPDIMKSLNFWQGVLGIDLDYIENVPSMDLDLAWLPVNKTRLELLEPTSAEGNEYHEFLKQHGPGFHHLCVVVDDLEEMVQKIKEKNIKVKDDEIIELPGRKLVFLDPQETDGVIVELYELT
ncbi:MAG TPA: VOC family protein [Anaerolineaceae bacterium]|nr:VOC family protein [Anaerolineaceae bacterium]